MQMIDKRHTINESPGNTQSVDVAGANEMLQNLQATDMLLKEFKELSSANSAGPEVKIEEIENLFYLAGSIQSKIDRALEKTQANERGKNLLEIRESIDESLGVVNLERLIARAEEIGVSRQAMTEAHQALSLTEQRQNNIVALERQLGLPEGAGFQWIKEEKVIKKTVDKLKPKISGLLKDIAVQVEEYPDAIMSLGAINLGTLGYCCHKELHIGYALGAIAGYFIPYYGQIALIESLYHGTLLKSANLKSINSPALSGLIDEVSRLGGQLTLRQDFGDRMRMARGYGFRAEMLLSIPTSRELKN
jgi:hypothetical protein